MKAKSRNDKTRRHSARQQRVRKGLARSDRPALTIYRSAKHIYAQLVEAESGRTLAAASTRSKSVMEGQAATGNVEAARKVGAAIAKLAQDQSIDRVVFNRNGFLYHGRVKALAEAARKAGLNF